MAICAHIGLISAHIGCSQNSWELNRKPADKASFQGTLSNFHVPPRGGGDRTTGQVPPRRSTWTRITKVCTRVRREEDSYAWSAGACSAFCGTWWLRAPAGRGTGGSASSSSSSFFGLLLSLSPITAPPRLSYQRPENPAWPACTLRSSATTANGGLPVAASAPIISPPAGHGCGRRRARPRMVSGGPRDQLRGHTWALFRQVWAQFRPWSARRASEAEAAPANNIRVGKGRGLWRGNAPLRLTWYRTALRLVKAREATPT